MPLTTVPLNRGVTNDVIPAHIKITSPGFKYSDCEERPFKVRKSQRQGYYGLNCSKKQYQTIINLHHLEWSGWKIQVATHYSLRLIWTVIRHYWEDKNTGITEELFISRREE